MDKQKKREEILELIAVPDVADYLFSALEQAKEKFAETIRQHGEAKDKSPQEIIPPDLSQLSIDKSYFFDLNRVETPGKDPGHQWVIEDFKFRNNPAIANFIFSRLFKKIDQLKIDSQKIETEVIQSIENTVIEINFQKTSDNHVGGFVKKISAPEGKPSANESKVIKISGKEINKEEMYQKIIRLMEENPEARKDIFFYYEMVQRSKGQFPK